MKKIFISAMIMLVAASCSDNLNDKAESMIEEDMKKTLVKPDSYEALTTVTDSAFTPMDDPLLYSLLLDIAGANVAVTSAEGTLEELRENIAESEKAMKMAVREKRSGYKEDYKKFKNIYDTCNGQIDALEHSKDSIINLIGDKLDIIKKRLQMGRQFIGFKSVQHYKALNIMNKELNDSCFYLFDKDFNKVVLSLPLKEYNSLTETLNVIREDFSSLGNDSIE